MSFGNNVRGKRVPPPLPMYQPVVLKHVPTMVRRRYQHFDVHKLDQHHDEGYLDGSDEVQLEDMGPGEISSGQGSVSEDDGNCDRLGLEHSVCIVEDTYVEAETRHNGLGNPSFNQGLRESEDNDLQDSNPSSEVDAGFSVEWQHSGEGNSIDDFDMGTYSGCVSDEIIQPTDLQSEYSKNEDDGPNVANHAPCMDSNIEDATQDERLSEFNKEQGDAKAASYRSFKGETLCMTERNSVSEQGLHSECRESEDDGSKVANNAPIVDSNIEDETHDKRLVDLRNEQDKKKTSFGNNVRGWRAPHPLPMYQPVVLKHVPTMVRRRYEHFDADKLDQNEGLRESEDNDLQVSNPSSEKNAGVSVECQNSGEGNSTDDCGMGTYSDSVSNGSIQPTDLQSEYGESEDDGPKDGHHALIVESSLQDETLDKRLADFSNKQRFSVKDSKGEVNGAGNAKIASFSSAKDEALDMTEGDFVNEQEYSKSDAPIVDFNLEHETHDKSLADLSNEQGLCSEDNIGECDEALDGLGCRSLNDKQDTLAEMYNEDFHPENCIRNRSLYFPDLQTEGDDRPKDMNDATDKNTRVKPQLQYNNEQDFNPEAFTKAVEEDGYELCCPYCKHCITTTLIYHRRENSQHCRITCFTSLFELLCCVRD